MTPEEKKLLKDIETSIFNIDVHLEGKRIWDEFMGSITKRRAVERELEIIGEAMNNLLKLNPFINLSYRQTVVDLRNRIIHAYGNVNNIIIWRIIMTDIPVLLTEVQQLLSEDEQ